MKANLAKILTSFILVLGIIGLAVTVISQPFRLVRFLLISAIIIGIFFLVMRNFGLPNQSMRKEQRAFIKAARQSKKRIKRGQKKVDSKKKQAVRKRYTSSTHLTVIEGKKGKKKNRAIH